MRAVGAVGHGGPGGKEEQNSWGGVVKSETLDNRSYGTFESKTIVERIQEASCGRRRTWGAGGGRNRDLRRGFCIRNVGINLVWYLRKRILRET
jgi:hypothetical protein